MVFGSPSSTRKRSSVRFFTPRTSITMPKLFATVTSSKTALSMLPLDPQKTMFCP